MAELVAALIQKDGRFLICKRPPHKARGLLWEFVGGKVEPGEGKKAALIRECKEELGIEVSPGEIYMELTHVYPDLTIHLTLYQCTILSGTPLMREHVDLKWIHPQQIPDFDFCPADEAILKKLRGE